MFIVGNIIWSRCFLDLLVLQQVITMLLFDLLGLLLVIPQTAWWRPKHDTKLKFELTMNLDFTDQNLFLNISAIINMITV